VNKTASRQAPDKRASGVSAFLRWLVLFLVVFDLSSSPLHAHSHDLGGADDAEHAVEVSEGHHVHDLSLDHLHADLHDAVAHHLESTHGPGFAHSVLALVPAKLASMVAHPATLIAVPAPVWPPLRTDESRERSTWASTHLIPPLGADRHWRPVSRAPPLSLHV
jgi:hypothetical protein